MIFKYCSSFTYRLEYTPKMNFFLVSKICTILYVQYIYLPEKIFKYCCATHPSHRLCWLEYKPKMNFFLVKIYNILYILTRDLIVHVETDYIDLATPFTLVVDYVVVVVGFQGEGRSNLRWAEKFLTVGLWSEMCVWTDDEDIIRKVIFFSSFAHGWMERNKTIKPEISHTCVCG